MSDQLIPKQPRRLLQPSKQVLRDQLALAATEIERLRWEVEWLNKPWWHRMIYNRTPYVPPVRFPNKPPARMPPPPPPTMTIREGVSGPTPTVPKQ